MLWFMMLLNTCMSHWIHNCQTNFQYFLGFHGAEYPWSSTSFILFVENASRLLFNVNTDFFRTNLAIMSGIQDVSSAAQAVWSENNRKSPEICMKELTLRTDKDEMKNNVVVEICDIDVKITSQTRYDPPSVLYLQDKITDRFTNEVFVYTHTRVSLLSHKSKSSKMPSLFFLLFFLGVS